jgi:hypothetical protein
VTDNSSKVLIEASKIYGCWGITKYEGYKSWLAGFFANGGDLEDLDPPILMAVTNGTDLHMWRI